MNDNAPEIKVAIFTSDMNSALTVYRTLGPYMKLPNHVKLQVVQWSQNMILWNSLLWADVVMMHTPHKSEHVSIAKTARHLKKKIIIDWDDDLVAIPPYNLAYPHIHGCEIALKELCLLADLVTVSTPSIARRCYALGANNVEIIPNAIDDDFYVQPLPRAKRTVLWRGGNSHQADLEIYRPVAKELAKRDYKLIFMGTPPTWGYEVSHVQMPPFEYVQFMRAFHHLAPSVVVVPLVDNEFNCGKSILAGLESALIGASVVASPVGEYANVPEFWTADTVDDWIYRIEEAENTQRDCTDLLERHRLSVVNKLRLSALHKLTGILE